VEIENEVEIEKEVYLKIKGKCFKISLFDIDPFTRGKKI